MEPSNRCDSWRPVYPVPHHHHHHHPRIPCSHDHHHHHHHTVLCPIHHHPRIHCPHDHHHTVLCPIYHHHHHLITWHSLVSPTMGPLPLQNHLNLESTTVQNVAHHSGTGTLLLQEQDNEGLQGVEEEEPIFVLTDEWREFFAKSEAKRKLEKKQAKKKQKN